MFVAYDKGRRIVVGFSKTIMAVWSEKRVLSMGFEVNIRLTDLRNDETTYSRNMGYGSTPTDQETRHPPYGSERVNAIEPAVWTGKRLSFLRRYEVSTPAGSAIPRGLSPKVGAWTSIG